MINVIQPSQVLETIAQHWTLKEVGTLNDHRIELAKLSGEYEWHSHEHEDKLFMVVQGTLRLEFRAETKLVQAGELIVIPRATEHKPAAETPEAWIILIEPKGEKS